MIQFQTKVICGRMADFTLRPHTFVVTRNTGGNNVPPTDEWSEITNGDCNVQTNPSGSIKNETEAMIYDYVVFYDITITEDIKVQDKIVADVLGKTITGIVKKWLPGQLSNRIWFNEISE